MRFTFGQPMKPLAIQHPTAERLAFIGAWSQLGIPIGLLITQFRVSSVVESFKITDLGDVASTKAALTNVISGLATVNTTLLYFQIASLVGLLLFAFSLFALRYRASWSYYFSVIYGPIVALLIIPFGTVLGVGLLGYTLSHRLEFAGQIQTTARRYNRRRRTMRAE